MLNFTAQGFSLGGGAYLDVPKLGWHYLKPLPIWESYCAEQGIAGTTLTKEIFFNPVANMPWYEALEKLTHKQNFLCPLNADYVLAKLPKTGVLALVCRNKIVAMSSIKDPHYWVTNKVLSPIIGQIHRNLGLSVVC